MYVPDDPETLNLPATLANGTSITVSRVVNCYRLERVTLERLATAASPDAMQLRVAWSKGYVDGGAYVAVHGTENRVEGKALDELLADDVGEHESVRSAVSSRIWAHLARVAAIPAGKVLSPK